MMETPQRALLVAPHPNVSEFWCAGTVARWISEGATVRYVICTDGGRGTTDLAVSRAELSARRAQEQALTRTRKSLLQLVPSACRTVQLGLRPSQVHGLRALSGITAPHAQLRHTVPQAPLGVLPVALDL